MFNAFEVDYGAYVASKNKPAPKEQEGDILVGAFMNHINKSLANSWRVAPLITCRCPKSMVTYKCAECKKTTGSYLTLKNHGCEKYEG